MSYELGLPIPQPVAQEIAPLYELASRVGLHLHQIGHSTTEFHQRWTQARLEKRNLLVVINGTVYRFVFWKEDEL